jgi:hypothetical protein
VATFATGIRTPFARYWLSGFLADFGDGVRLAAFPLLAAQLTRSPAAVAAVTAVQGLPWLLLGGGLGVVVDRTDRRRLMVTVDVARAAVIAALAAAILAHSAGLCTLGIAVLLLLTLPGVFGVPPGEQHHAPDARSSLRHDFGEGLRWLWQHTDIRDVTIVAGLVSALDAAWFAVLVLFVVRDLHQQPGAYGLLLAGAPPLALAVAVLAWRHRRGQPGTVTA